MEWFTEQMSTAWYAVLDQLDDLEFYAQIVIVLVALPITAVLRRKVSLFCGALLGVDLGFGLQQVAANFISGLIILMDRTITIGDYIELEDGRRARCTSSPCVRPPWKPSTARTSWCQRTLHHDRIRQLASLQSETTLFAQLPGRLQDRIWKRCFPSCATSSPANPKVPSGDDLPLSERLNAEIQSFDDSGITILIEFWMEGIDDGDDCVGADLLMMIWTALKANGIEILFPQREIKIMGEEEKSA